MVMMGSQSLVVLELSDELALDLGAQTLELRFQVRGLDCRYLWEGTHG